LERVDPILADLGVDDDDRHGGVPMVAGVDQVDDAPPVAAEVAGDPIAQVGVVRKRFDQPMMSPR
jgi:hypothetical protein